MLTLLMAGLSYYLASFFDENLFVLEKIGICVMILSLLMGHYLIIDISWGLFKFFVKLAIQ